MNPRDGVMVRYWLAMLDVDGTLRRRDVWNEGATHAVRQLIDAGLSVALCSGRSTQSLIQLADELPGVSLLCSGSGSTALVRDENQWRVLGHRAIAPRVVDEALTIAADAGVEVWAYNQRQWLAPGPSPMLEYEARFIGDSPVFEPIAGRGDLGKVLPIVPEAKYSALAAKLDALDGVRVVISASFDGGFYADVVPEESTATKGGDFLLDHLGIEWDQVLAAGDGSNDIGMLSRAGLAITVAPMTPEALGAASPHQRRVAAADTQAMCRLLPELL
ncbi:MAG: HAD hydrolase family protein [Arachnia sp.]